MDQHIFAVRLNNLRQNKRLTQEDLSKKLAVTPQAISKWERGLSLPDVSIIPELSKILGVSCDVLLLDSDYYEQEEMSEVNIDEERKGTSDPIEVLSHDVVELQIGLGHVPLFTVEETLSNIGLLRKKILLDKGVFVHPIRVRDNEDLDEYGVRILIKGSVVLDDIQEELTSDEIVDLLYNTMIKHLKFILTIKGTKELLKSLKGSPYDIVDDVIPEYITLFDFHKELVRKVEQGEGINNIGDILERMILGI